MKRTLIIVCTLALFASCRVVNPSVMLRTPGDYTYATANDSLEDEYKIAPDDILSFLVLANKGERLVTGMMEQGVQNAQMQGQGALSYVIEKDGTAKLPLLGEIHFAGMNRREAEAHLEKLYAAYINDPYVKITLDNRRVFVFRGETASVIKLENQNTTLFEVLAQAGGTSDSKAHRIKLIRKKNNTNEVYQINLSRVENINQGNIVLQSNDVIYITPRERTAERIVAIIAPYLSLLATAVAVIALFK